MITIQFGRWFRKSIGLFKYDRIYFKGYIWTPFCKKSIKMKNPNNYQELKQIIQEANSHKTWIKEYNGHHNIIRLSNVLLAVGKKHPTWFNRTTNVDKNMFFISIEVNNTYWDLTKDLDNQSKETKQFLIKLLVK